MLSVPCIVLSVCPSVRRAGDSAGRPVGGLSPGRGDQWLVWEGLAASGLDGWTGRQVTSAGDGTRLGPQLYVKKLSWKFRVWKVSLSLPCLRAPGFWGRPPGTSHSVFTVSWAGQPTNPQKPGALKPGSDSDTFETRHFLERLYGLAWAGRRGGEFMGRGEPNIRTVPVLDSDHVSMGTRDADCRI